jgi:hypothetical protein
MIAEVFSDIVDKYREAPFLTCVVGVTLLAGLTLTVIVLLRPMFT